MRRSPRLALLTGAITVVVFGGVGVSLMGRHPLAGSVLVALAAFRAFYWTREILDVFGDDDGDPDDEVNPRS